MKCDASLLQSHLGLVLVNRVDKRRGTNSFPFYTIQAIKELKLDTDGEVASIKAQLAEVTIANEELSRISNIEADIAGMEGKMASLEAQLQQLRDSTNIGNVASLSAEVEGLKIRADKTDEKMSSISARLAFLEGAMLSGSGSAVLGESTGSAELSSDTITVNELNVTGDASVSDLGVSGDISSGYMTIKGYDDSLSTPGASINTIGGPLRIQPMGLEAVEIMGNKVSIDTVGNMKVEGTVTAAKVETKEVSTEKLNIVEPVEAEEATESATITTKSIGEAVIPAGETELVIETSAIGEGSFVFTTPKTKLPVSIAVTEQEAGESFTVEIPEAQLTDVKFNWWIVN